MDGARLLDGLITTEFSFIQELVWSAPHKNPFPLCSHSILSRLKILRGEWRRGSPTTHQSAMSQIAILDADIKFLIELRKRCLKLLECRDSTSDASTNTVYLAKNVDSFIVQHLEDAWKELSFNFTDTDFQQQKYIDQDCLAADVLKLFVLDAPHKSQSRNKDGTAEANSTVPETEYQENDAAELGTGKHSSPLQGQSSSARDEHSTGIADQEPGIHNLTKSHTIEDAGKQTTTNNTTLQKITSDENSFKGSGIEKNLGVAITSTNPITTRSSKCDTPKVTRSTSIQAQSILLSDEGPKLSIITPDVVKDAGRRTIGTSQRFSLAYQDSTAMSEGKPHQFIKEMEDIEDAVDQAVTTLQESSSSSATDEYFSASSDDEHGAIIETKTKNSDNSQMRAAIVVNGSALLTGENGSEISEVQRSSPGAGPACPGETQIFSSNSDTNGKAQKFDEHDLGGSLGENVGIKDNVKSNSDGNSSKEELVEVEMTLRAKICEPESEEPYWHVMFALLNYSNFKVSVQKLEYWSLDKQEDVTCIQWPPGEMILREQPSFLCHGIKVSCSASNTSPRLAFSWKYRKGEMLWNNLSGNGLRSKLPEWIPTKDGKPKIENPLTRLLRWQKNNQKQTLIDDNMASMQKGTIRKRLGNMLTFGNAKRKLKHDTGHLSLKSAKKRTA